jgi:hypothetical protein
VTTTRLAIMTASIVVARCKTFDMKFSFRVIDD